MAQSEDIYLNIRCPFYFWNTEQQGKGRDFGSEPIYEIWKKHIERNCTRYMAVYGPNWKRCIQMCYIFK